uniref:Uncharacterized protein n=1 Tax=viral metagenome TaxID=1070528 RepID=A0A6M3J0Q6_9ZZZZ
MSEGDVCVNCGHYRDAHNAPVGGIQALPRCSECKRSGSHCAGFVLRDEGAAVRKWLNMQPWNKRG